MKITIIDYIIFFIFSFFIILFLIKKELFYVGVLFVGVLLLIVGWIISLRNEEDEENNVEFF